MVGSDSLKYRFGSKQYVFCCLFFGWTLIAFIALSKEFKLYQRIGIIPTPNDRLFSFASSNASSLSAQESEGIRYSNVMGNCSKPVYSWAFVKTHKCGSDSLSSWMLRLAEENEIELPLPLGQWNLNYPLKPGKFYRSRKASGRFDMQVLHMMFDEPVWNKFMEPGSPFISVVRQPYSQFKSFFNYFAGPRLWSRYEEYANVTSKSEAFDIFMKNSGSRFPGNLMPFRNPMLFDFGFKEGRHNATKFIAGLVRKFPFMFITDHMQESLVAFRELFCLSLKDILMSQKNVLPNQLKNSQQSTSDEEYSRIYRDWSTHDYMLFEEFNRTLWDKIGKISKFEEKLKDYKEVNFKVNRFCASKQGTKLLVRANEFHEEFTIGTRFCARLQMHILAYIDKLKNQRFNASSPSYGRIYYK